MSEKIKNNVVIAAIITGICTIIAAIIVNILHNETNGRDTDHLKLKSYKISGTVIDYETFEGVSHAEISVVGQTESYITEDNGNFYFEVYLPEPTIIRLRVKKVGYKEFDQSITPPNEQKQIMLKK